MPFLFAAVIYIFVEAYVLFWAADTFGVLRVFLVLGASALLGLYLVRSQGLNVFNRANHALAKGESPHVEMLDGIVLLLCGVILIVPGLVSDVLVLPLLIPAFRKTVARRMALRMGRAGYSLPSSPFTNPMDKDFYGQGPDGTVDKQGSRYGGQHGPFVFYRFFMSGTIPRRELGSTENTKNEYFDEYDSSEIIDVTPKQPGRLDSNNPDSHTPKMGTMKSRSKH